MRWQSLLKLKCRNRILLTGTPIQNEMHELWALLHFIMPEFFDNPQEFSEWFSKGIEEHAAEAAEKAQLKDAREAVGQRTKVMDSRQIQRLHLILKPFMLRRIKKDVENEMAAKIELIVDCALSQRQARIYKSLTQRAKSNAAMKGGARNAAAEQEELMNMVMQLRKVCNHPDCNERRPVHSSYYFTVPHPTATAHSSLASAKAGMHKVWAYQICTGLRLDANPLSSYLPSLLLDLHYAQQFNRHILLNNIFNLWNADYIHRQGVAYVPFIPNAQQQFKQSQPPSASSSSIFHILRLTDYSPAEAAFLCHADTVHRWLIHIIHLHRAQQLRTYHNSAALQLPDASSELESLSASCNSLKLYPSAAIHRRALLNITATRLPLPSIPSTPSLYARIIPAPSALERSHSYVPTNVTVSSTTKEDNKTDFKVPSVDAPPADTVHLDLWYDAVRNMHDGGFTLLTGTTNFVLKQYARLYLPATTAPCIVPLFKNAPHAIKVRNGYGTEQGFEKDLITGVDLRKISKGRSANLPTGIHLPFSYSRTHNVVGAAFQPIVPVCSYAPVTVLPGLCTPWFRTSGTMLSRVDVPGDVKTLIHDSGKMQLLDGLLKRLKAEGHRVLIFSQMTKVTRRTGTCVVLLILLLV